MHTRTLVVLIVALFLGSLSGCAEKPAAEKPAAEKPEQAKPEQAKPEQAKPEQAKPEQAGKTGDQAGKVLESEPANPSEPQELDPAGKAEPAEKAEGTADRAEQVEKGPSESDAPEAQNEKVPEAQKEKVEMVRERQKQFVPVRIEWDKSLLDEQEIELVRTLVRAARVIDHIFWMQATPSGLEWRKKLATRKDPEARVLFHYLMINYGPYDRLNAMEPFLGEKSRPMGGNYYPEDMTKEEFEEWLAAHPEDEAAFKSNFTVLRRNEDGGLKAVPYSEAYERELEAANRLLLQAAGLTSNESLKSYLKERAAGFLSNDYFASDMAWMDLDSKIEVTIGPYEVYEDHLFGYKAAFEAFVTVKDPAATEKLDTFKSWLEKLEQNLPIPDEHKNFKRGKSSPMPVVDVIFTAGDTRAGVQTIAFNLPNDERVREEKGCKKVMLRNVGMAKFQKILKPIAGKVLEESLAPTVHPDAYFNHTLLHEISHGLGPGTITMDGEETTVNLALKELYPHLEEAKADICGLYNALFLIDQGVVQLAKLDAEGKPIAGEFLGKQEALDTTVATFLAGIFRSTRFGVHEAHGKANLMLFNFLKSKGAFLVNQEGRMGYDLAKAKEAVKECAHEILMIQAAGDYEAGKAFIATYGEVPDSMRTAWERLKDLPVDIEPIYDLP